MSERVKNMKKYLSLLIIFAMLFSFLPLNASSVQAADGSLSNITEYTIPTDISIPFSIVAGPDGAMWFTEFNGNKIGKITMDGTITEYPVPTEGSVPLYIIVGPDNALWFTELSGNKIGRITTSGEINEYSIPTPGCTPTGITVGSDNALWFTEQTAFKIGRITTNGEITEYSIPNSINGYPYDIIEGSDGNMWFTRQGANIICRFNYQNNEITEYSVPTASSSPKDIITGQDGVLWFTEKSGSKIGRITTSGMFTEYTIPTNNSSPDSITAGPDGALWFNEAGANNIGRIGMDGTITEYHVSESYCNLNGIATGPDGALWFTEMETGKIGRLLPPITLNPSSITAGYTGTPSITVTGVNFISGTTTLNIKNSTNSDMTNGAILSVNDTTHASFNLPNGLPAGTYTVTLTTGSDVVTTTLTIMPQTAASVAAGITSVTPPTAGTTSLTMPTVPSGYTITIASSDNTAVVAVNGTITPPATNTTVNLTFTVTNTADSSTATTASIQVTVPAITSEPPTVVDTGTITEYTIQTEDSRPLGITAGPDGAMWFCESKAKKIGRITTDGLINEYSANNTPYSIVAGPDGAMWFTEPENGKIGKITMDGTITEYMTSSNESLPLFIVAGPDGAMWFTEQGTRKIGRITTNGEITEFSVLNDDDSLTDITAGSDGALWFTYDNVGKIGRITTNGVITEFKIPADNSNFFGIAAGPDGALWFIDQNNSKIGRITTNGTITEYSGITKGSSPTLIAAGPDNAMWFTELGVNKIGRIAMDGTISKFSIPTGGSSPVDITLGPDGNIWFTEFQANKIGKLTSTSLVAARITSVTSPISGATSVTMPTVPDGYTIAITTSSNTNVIATDGTINSPSTDTTVNLTFTVTNTSNHSAAITKSFPVTVPGVSSGNGNNGSPGNPTTTATPANTGVEILVNGRAENAGTAETITRGGRTETTVTVDSKRLEEKLEREGNRPVVTIPVDSKADVIAGVLTGEMVKNMEEKQAVLEIKTGNVTYTLPASQINIDNVSEQIGQQVALKDIKVNVTISAPPQDTVKIVEDTADKSNYKVVVKPIEFSITCSSGGRTVDVSKFNGYVERTVALPDGVDPSKITTGIVLNADGTFSHVPTVITMINGKYYAKINSLTNSTYSVIFSPKAFIDVEKHWAKDAVNDMASRLIISGAGNDMFAPDRNITRAEFAAIIIRGLGLMRPGTGKASFNDVSKSDWYYDAVSIACEYGIISGYGNGKFGPNDKLTREQAMSMVSRAMKITGLESGITDGEMSTIFEKFSDAATASNYAKESIALCIKNGIISGINSTIAPKNYITRAEVAVIVQRLLQKSNLI